MSKLVKKTLKDSREHKINSYLMSVRRSRIVKKFRNFLEFLVNKKVQNENKNKHKHYKTVRDYLKIHSQLKAGIEKEHEKRKKEL